MPMTSTESPRLSHDGIIEAAHRAARAIPPLWPLASSVAVNPFLGQTGEPLATAAARLRRTAGIALTMPRAWYAQRWHAGEIAEADLQAALQRAPAAPCPPSLSTLKHAMQGARGAPQAIPTVADLARQVATIDWPGIVNERIGHWASSYFDQGQALWSAGPSGGAYAAWRVIATHDLSPEVAGLTGFARHMAQMPVSAEDAIVEGAVSLGLSQDALESYFHRLLSTLGGWAQLARYRLWQAELNGGHDASVIDLLAIRMAWEVALLRKFGAQLASRWQMALCAYAAPVSATSGDLVDSLLQEAAECAAQRRLGALLADASPARPPAGRAQLQMAFCIDVRSEVFRRALESLDPGIQTLGFAGFFGLGIGHRRFASDVVEARLPVLLAPAVFTRSGEATPALTAADLRARIKARTKRAWGRFKLAVISSFAFVEATGPVYVAKLLRDGLALTRHRASNDPPPHPASSLDLETRLTMATRVLKAMSLTTGFARLVILAGHGANVVNNPHASALHCGACGGYSGAAACLPVGVQPDEAHQRVRGVDFALGQALAQLGRAALPFRRTIECGFLRGVVVGDSQGHQLFQRDGSGAVVGHQARRDVGELQAALHHQRGHAEVGGNVLDGPAVLDQRGERLELVGGVHLLAHQVFREADSAGRSIGHQQARHFVVGGDALLLRQQLQGGQAAITGHYRVSLAIGGKDDDKVLQQADAGNARGQFRDGQARHLAGVALGAARQQLRERNQNQVLGRVGHF